MYTDPKKMAARFAHNIATQPRCVCGSPKSRHTDGEDGNRINVRTARGIVTECQGFQRKMGA